MKDDNIKKEFHLFLLTDYETEEELLREKNRNGSRLTKVGLPGIYTFEKCEPEDVIYRLDFNPLTKTDRAGYLQIYEDYGWEYITRFNDYNYFRKSAKDVKAEEDAEIFSDPESKLAMLKNIFCKRMIPIMLILLFCGLPSIAHLYTGSYKGIFDEALTMLCSTIFLLYLYGFIHCSIGFFRLKKKYTNE